MPRLSANSCITCYQYSPSPESNFTYLRHRILDNLLICHIALVAHQQLVHAFRSVAVDLLKPLLHIVEAVHVRDIVDNADAMSAAVVGGCDSAEAFLTGCVPLCLPISI